MYLPPVWAAPGEQHEPLMPATGAAPAPLLAHVAVQTDLADMLLQGVS